MSLQRNRQAENKNLVTETLVQYRYVTTEMLSSGVRTGDDLAVGQELGTSALRFPVPSGASELLTMGESFVPSN